MTGFELLQNVRERLVTLLCLGLVISAGTVSASRTEAQTATATATVNYSVADANWMLGTASETDDGGNYNSAGYSPYSVTATVNIGDTVKTREGTITVTQNFIQNTPDSPLQFYTSETVTATIGSSQQEAQAWSGTASPITVHQLYYPGTASDSKMAPTFVFYATSYTKTDVIKAYVTELDEATGPKK